ncbi:MAG: acyl--CoA ligase [Deltaproteobacteria bacterium]|nr:acyl--CoA ligase [Deltaproteobacteria bacterium]MBW2360030.1 acyl--CoA ligase [Deltaproteobacteria bacterium]
MNLMMLLEMASQGFGSRRGIESEDTALSYEEIFRAAGAAAEEVRRSGAKHLALLDVSSPAVPVALFAAAWAGVPFVPLNYRLTGDELHALLARIEPAYLVTEPERADTLRDRAAIVTTRQDFLAAARNNPTPEPSWSMDPDEISILLFTSGTTGTPKAAVLRHKHLVSYILGSVEFGAAAEDDAVLVSVPPYHIAGMASVLSSVYAGRRIVQLPNFDPAEWISLARDNAVSNAFVVPTMLSRIVESLGDVDSADMPALRALSYGGGKMPLAVIERAMALFPDTAFTNAYGLTETSSTVTLLGPDDHRTAVASDDPAMRQRLVSVGRALPSIEIEIRNDEGEPLPPGERGEIHVRGEQVSGEYLGRGSVLAADGWFPTRDGGWLDEEGYLFLEGRVDDVIVRGGENLSPGEIEDVLLEHPAVADAAVVGIPDEEWGEAVAAAIALKPGQQVTEAELQELVRQQLRSSRVPTRIVFKDELPYNETGKLLRRIVRAEFAQA